MSERFRVDLRGIIDLTSNHMYSSPDVFVRETIQNGHDAIMARRREDPAFEGAIRIELVRGDKEKPSTICVTDDGIGLTTDEVHEFLSTVGASSKRDKTNAEDDDEPGEPTTFLGRFGIGLLSCFMVTDEIGVVSRSARDRAAPAVEWRGKADGGYTVREMPDSTLRPGTSVFLAAKADAEEYYEYDTLVEISRRYAEMLPVRVIVQCGENEVDVNRERPAWELDADDEVALNDLCQSLLGFAPIDVFPIDAPAGAIRGFAFIRSDRIDSWGGENRLYSGGMFVGNRVYGLIPEWAGFIGCILNTTKLRLTASREGLHQGDELEKACDEIAAAIRARLAQLLRHDRPRFERVMKTHDTEIRGLAVKDSEFLELIADFLEFDTTLGAIRFGEFRREHEKLYLARTPEQFRRLLITAAEAGIRVFNGGYTYHEELLCRAAERHPELEVSSFDTADLANLMDPAEYPEAFADLLEAGNASLSGRGVEVVVRDFAPVTLPAFFALGLDAEFHRQLDETKSEASGLWEEILDAMAPRPESLSPTRLCLNGKSPLVRSLAAFRDRETRRDGVEILYVQALMNGQHILSSDDLAMLHRAMERLLWRSTERAGRA